MAKYRKRPVVVDAVQLRWRDWDDVCTFLGPHIGPHNPARQSDSYSDKCREMGPYIELTIETVHGPVTVRHGDWILRGPHGDLWPIKPEIFADTYQVDEGEGRDYRKERDAAYVERNRLAAALARLIVRGGGKAWLAEHDPADAAWDPEWRTIVFIDGPTGQLSWHLHDSDVALFDGLPRGPNTWDQHTTEEKYERVARLGR